MNLLQWNIQWCRGMDGHMDVQRIARVARELADPDVACFQEVAINYPALAGSRGEDQVAELSAAFPGYSAHFVWGPDVPDTQGGRRRFGNLLLSRLPVHQVLRHSLPWPAHAEVPTMQRTAIEAVIEVNGAPLRITTTHLEYYSATQRYAQVEALRTLHANATARARATPSKQYNSGPFQPLASSVSGLITGDFNMRTDDPAYARMLAPIDGAEPLIDVWSHCHPHTPHAPTFCVFDSRYSKTPYCCDFIFASRDLAPRLRKIRVDLDTQASDHQPVILHLA
jgi:endonuclease/exonuclease/phosphatase family metal-dependent hydrolase